LALLPLDFVACALIVSVQRCYKTQVWKPGNLLYEDMLEYSWSHNT